jgi:hypothetical protein
MGIINNGRGRINRISDPWNGYNGKIGIELRGSSAAQFPKKPYGFETRDSTGANLNVSLLGMPPENDWVLYNPFSDKTLMRNVLAFKISNDIGRYASRTRLIEVDLNGEYQGVYVLMEKIKQDKNRVAVSKMDSADTAGDALTGGYIIKVDKSTGENTGGWSSANKVFYQYHYPKPDEITPEQKAYIRQFMDGFEAAIGGPGESGPDPGYTDVIDLDSFVDNFIVSEVTRNIDAYRLSMYFFKDRDSMGGKLNAGPVWDCDLAFGNVNYHEGWLTDGWNLDALVNSSEGRGVPYWWMHLRNDPVFLSRVQERWNAFRKDALDVDSLVQFIDAVYDTLQESQERNFTRWRILGTYQWPNMFIGQTFDEEVEFLKEWLQNRMAWLDENIRAIVSEAADWPEPAMPGDCWLEPNYPNPFNSRTTIRYGLKAASRVRLTVFDILGRHVRTLSQGFKAPGVHTAAWDGRDDRGRSVPSGIYTCRLDTGPELRFRKMVLLQ